MATKKSTTKKVDEKVTAEEIDGVKVAVDDEFEGEDYWEVTVSDNLGRAVVEIKPEGWVGPGFLFPAARVSSLAKALGTVKKELPEQL